MRGTVWVLVFALAPIITAAVALVAWRRRRDNPAARALALVLVGVSVWCLAVGLVLAPVPPAVRAAGFPAIFLAVGATVVGFLALSRVLADPGWRPRRWLVALVAVEPVLLAVCSSLPATTDLVFGRTDLTAPAGAVQMIGGPLFAAHSAYSYAFIALGLLRLARTALRGPQVVRRQAAVLLASALPPTAGNLVLTVGMQGSGVVDLTPLFFIVTGLVAGWAILRLGLLAVVPVARDQVVETMTDGVLVTDAVGRVIDLNPAARALLTALRPGAGATLLGRPLRELTGPDLLDAVLPDGPGADGTYSTGRAVVEAAPGRWLDVQSVPVASAGRRIGRVTVVRDVTEAQLREADLRRLAQQLAEQVATIDRLRATLAEEAVRDPLTGLHNRRHLDRALLHDLARSVDEGLPVAVVLVDVDRFKSVNDRFGHGTGDAVLCAVAAELRAGTRTGDTVARAGGEEFVLVLPGADEAEALARAETVRARVGALRHPVPDGVLAVTLSAGVAVARHGGRGAADLLARADRALYRAKSGGRDRVVVAGDAGADVRDVLSTA
ncbi:diguanylate cyclase [Klenkia terrae]|uniref:Diguanylate cyclase n=1 Tax=Klenkia terrae TaxID=1052259 RepID=A0ABU8EA83_9ACTN